MQLAAYLLLPLLSASGLAANTAATLYKNPHCTCCDAYAEYLRQHDYTVAVVPTN